ncbi:venom serine carboxypeptidase-like isoform X2 [Dermacentor variabilis]|uniref:venom serine carboxypeptidase-like isoform X2 n=1 Tax=Dermacentor variabilis TaxID=34621 RepID=UPI003F5B6385
MAKTILLSWLILILKANASSGDALSATPKAPSFLDLITKNTPKDVEFFKTKAGVDAKSGYITVQKGSHLFFLLLKSPQNKSDAPLILWLEGGPGKSGLHGQFLKNGPIGIDAQGNLYNRSSTFLNFADILYVDYPAGGGFSIIQNGSVLSTSLDNVTNDLLTFLNKFYQLFNDYRSRNLYLVGESYGARAAVALAERLRTEECENRLRGLILCAGFLIPLQDSILKSHEYLYQLGLVDAEGRTALETKFKLIEAIAKTNTTIAAFLLAQTVFNFNIGGMKSLFANLTGYDDQGSILHTTKPAEVGKYQEYVNSSDFKKQLGVPQSVKLDEHRLNIAFKLAPGDYFKNISATFENVLGSEKVLIVNGQMDDIFPPGLFEEYFSKMTFTGSTEFAQVPRMPWTIKNQYGLAGYVRESENLTVALVLRAGHLLGFDASEAVYDLVHHFVNASKHNEQQDNGK